MSTSQIKRVCGAARRRGSKMSREQRAKLLARGMQLIYNHGREIQVWWGKEWVTPRRVSQPEAAVVIATVETRTGEWARVKFTNRKRGQQWRRTAQPEHADL